MAQPTKNKIGGKPPKEPIKVCVYKIDGQPVYRTRDPISGKWADCCPPNNPSSSKEVMPKDN